VNDGPSNCAGAFAGALGFGFGVLLLSSLSVPAAVDFFFAVAFRLGGGSSTTGLLLVRPRVWGIDLHNRFIQRKQVSTMMKHKSVIMEEVQ
jgi:hypothetical protein